MKNIYTLLRTTLCCLALFFIGSCAYAQDNIPEWSKRYRASRTDIPTCALEVSDGYILGGSSDSYVGRDKSDVCYGGMDYWIIKTDKYGNKLWDGVYGGSQDDDLKKIFATPDGGFLLIGTSVSNVSGNKFQPNRGDQYTEDYWVVKISSTGVKLWDKAYGGDFVDNLKDAIATKDGGFLLAGSSASSAGFEKSEGARTRLDQYGNVVNSWDYWLVKIDSNGQKLWDKTYGGDGNDQSYTLAETEDGKIFIGGNSTSGISGDKSDPTDGSPDTWILKLTENGEKIWDKAYGVNGIIDGVVDMITTPDNGLVMFHYLNYWPKFKSDQSLIRLNADGNIIWEKTIVGKENLTYLVGVSYIEKSATGFYLLSTNSTDGFLYNSSASNSIFLATCDWDGNVIDERLLLNASTIHPQSFLINSSNNILVAYYDFTPGIADYRAATYNLSNSLRLEAEYNSGSTDVGQYSIGTISSTIFSNYKTVRIYDKGDKIKISFSTSEGNFRIMARVRSGAYSNSTNWSNPTSYWPNGYKFSVDEAPVVLTGINSSVSEKNSTYGNSFWGTMESDLVSLTAGVHTFEIESNKLFVGVDYIEIVGAGSSEINPVSSAALENTIAVYPNPFSDRINVTLANKATIQAYSLSDVFGNKLFEGTSNQGQSSLSLDVTSFRLNAGVYILRLQTSMGDMSKMVTKQ